MSTDDEWRKGICILSFDSGGPGTYSQLLILKEYMGRLADDLGCAEDEIYPADYFDLMGGVGFGGFVAIVIGHLRMNVSQAIDALGSLASMMYPKGSEVPIDRENNSKVLKQVIEGTIQARGIPLETKMKDKLRTPTRCKVVLYIAASANISHPQAFRTYPSRGSSLDPTIVEAACAAMAVPSHFVPVKIGPPLMQQSFIGGAFGTSNPTHELLKEASAIFGKNGRVAQIISIGAGLPRVLSVDCAEDEQMGHRHLADMMADCETVAQELATRLYNVDAYIRLNVNRGMEAITMSDWDKLGNIESHTNAYIGTTVVTQVLDASLRSLRERSGFVTLEQINQSSSIKIAAKTAPSVSPYFVLRIKEWEKLVWHLVTSPSSRQRILPITGMGGRGKTQLVSYFLQEYPALFKHVGYVDASSLSSIKADLQAWARALGNGHERDSWEDAVRIFASGSGDERWGLILDNADDPTLNLVPFIPKNINLAVIITSRNRNLSNLSTTHHMELGEMKPDEALTTLLHAARRQSPLSTEESESAHTLLKELGCLAVALVQAGTYCHELSVSFTQYLKLFYTHRAELMKNAEPSALDNYQRGAYTTLDLSYTALPQTAREFLHFISYFHHTDIPLAALAAAAGYKFDDDEWSLHPRPDDHVSVPANLEKLLCVNGIWSEMQVQATLRTLRSFSLLSITSTGESVFLQLHPLIQAWSRDMDTSTSRHYRSMAAQIITSCSRDAEFQLHRHLISHILDILGQPKSEELHIHDLMAAGKILLKQGYYQAAAGAFESALEAIPKANDPRINSTVSGWLADVYRDQGRWTEAEKLQMEVLEQRGEALGNEHPETIQAASRLAMTYYVQSRWSEAEKIGVEVLEKRRKILGMDHPDTIGSAADLAATFLGQGRWGEAERLGVEVLEQQRRVLGMEHPDTILVAGNLASIYHAQGRWNEAEKLDTAVLEQRWRILGNEHPDTVAAAANLAVTYRQQGRWAEAENLEVGVLEQRRRILGIEHPAAIRAAANLAVTYRQQGRWIEAEKLELEVLGQRRRILGKGHPDTIRAAGNLAATHRGQGRWSEAEKLEVEVLEMRTKILGVEHPDTILAAASLAATYGQQGRWTEEAALLAPTVQLSLKVLGQQHPYTQRYIHGLVCVHEKLGNEKDVQETRDLLIS